MAAKIGDLIVELKANTAAFSADMGKATASMNSAVAQMRTGMNSVSNAFTLATRAAGVFGLSLGVAALVNFGRRSLDAAGGLGEMAEQLGITTDSLQTYQFAAAQSGVSTEEMQVAIQRFTRSIGDARDGSDTAVKAVRALGGEFERMVASGASIDALLLAFADRIAITGDRTVAAARGADLMGRGFQRFLPIFQSGAAGIQAFAAQLDNMGARLDEDAIRKADGASDAIARMNFQVNALAQSLVSRLAPAIESAARGWNALINPTLDQEIVKANNRLIELRNELARLGEQQGLTPRGVLEPAIARTKREIEVMEKRVAELIGKAREQAVQTPNPPAADAAAGPAGPAASGGLTSTRDRQLIQGLEIQRDSIDQVGAALLRVKLEREIDEKGQRLYSDATIATAVAIQEQTDALTRASEAGKMFAQISADNAKQQEDDRLKARERSDAILQMRSQIEVSIQREHDDTRALTQALGESQRAYEEEAEFIRIRNQYRAAGIPLYGQEIEAARRLAARNVEANRNLERTGAASQELANFMDRSFDRIGAAITDATVKGKDGFIDMGSIGRAVLAELQQEAIKLSLINPFKNWAFGQNNPTSDDVFGKIFGAVGSIFGGASASGFSAGTASLPNFGAATVTPGFAAGTDNAPPGWALVGEQGPELVRFRGSEQVFSNAESRAMGGGRGGGTVYIDARGADKEGLQMVARAVREIDRNFEKRAMTAIFNGQSRAIMPR